MRRPARHRDDSERALPSNPCRARPAVEGRIDGQSWGAPANTRSRTRCRRAACSRATLAPDDEQKRSARLLPDERSRLRLLPLIARSLASWTSTGSRRRARRSLLLFAQSDRALTRRGRGSAARSCEVLRDMSAVACDGACRATFRAVAVGPQCLVSRREGSESDQVPPDLDQRLGLASKPIATR